MKLSISLLICILFFTLTVKCQEILGTDAIFINNLSSVYQDPDQTGRVAKYLLENASSSTEIVQAHYLLSISSEFKGNAAQSIQELFKAKDNLTKETSPLVTTLVYSEISERYSVAGMETVGEKFALAAHTNLAEISSEEKIEIAETILSLHQSNRLEHKEDVEKALQKLLKIEANYTGLPPIILARTSNKIAALYTHNQKLDLAKAYYEKALSQLKNSGGVSSSLSAMSYHGLGNVYFEKDELEASKQYYKQALAILYIEKPLKFSANKSLSEIYKRQDSAALLQKYYNENVLLHSQLQYSERNVRSTLVSHLQQDQESILQTDKKLFYSWGTILALLFIITIASYYFYNRKLNKEYERFKELIAQVEKDKKLEVPYKVEEVITKPTKAVVIPEETIQTILERLDAFEKSNKFTDSKMNLTLLAKQLKSNSKYISEIIHTHKQKNFNSYINELRINYIIKLMKTEKAYLTYKVSYLAESSGFSSHSAFTVVFKNITGFTPKQFITFLKKSKKENS